MNHVPVPPQDQEAQAAAEAHAKEVPDMCELHNAPMWARHAFLAGVSWQKSREIQEKSENEIDDRLRSEGIEPVWAVARADAAIEKAISRSREQQAKPSQTEEEMAAKVGHGNSFTPYHQDCGYCQGALRGLRRGAEAEREKQRLDAGSWENTALSLDRQLASALAEIAALKAELGEARVSIRSKNLALNQLFIKEKAWKMAQEQLQWIAEYRYSDLEGYKAIQDVARAALKLIRASSGPKPKEGKDG